MSRGIEIVLDWLKGGLGGGWQDWLSLKVQSIGDFIFFRLILTYLRKEIRDFGIELMGNAMQWVGGIALTLMTLWILIQGYRIATGQSREPMMALVTNSLRAAFIVGVATSMAAFGTNLHTFFTEDVSKEIHWIVTGDDSDMAKKIDDSLAWMQVALTSIDMIDVVRDPTLDDDKTRAMWFVGMGTGGPAIVAGISLLLYEIAMALFVGLGPIFILCLLFDQTKQLFSRWLYYGIGTLFSMAVLSAMVSIALEMVTRVAASFWGTALLGKLMQSNFSDGMTSQAMQQGGMGLILTVLIISAPPMAAMFFQGVLGQFSSYSAFASAGGGGSPPGSGLPPGYVGSQGYQRANPGGGNQGGGYQPQPMQTNPAENPATRVTSPTQNQNVKDEILKNK
ncbi:type IV secretion system protein [Lysobacter silvisoli]|uniref:Type VI secretion protein n=1 Tax=Lysobacter silvisoli TaxID=2293254 RepID=A0A371K4G0_9GAMM|nr:type IV secretion system protein [Lysobacter silvisoli]RDZ28737.1 type VI secretion protein [Lysobacter silvisoli]